MLQIKQICKEYRTGNLIQKALDNVSLNLRENEFVAILGPSGSGKTTLLNIIGGLDRYDSGDLIINGISTKKYKDRDWDSYRNHTIGFVFQSYNLIPHQTVLSNVELALTISGVSRSKRRELAKKALEQVGLGNQLHKKPNQMSGGQMQRVAIARALVNDPDILLADEPTGALDSDTSIQVMELLKEVAKDRLVVMVTHNPELAKDYATRIVNLKDGVILSDSKPYNIEENSLEPPKHKNMGKASMSFFTALSLSFNNLRTKKARTLLTSFAGSIGIIGIALILSLSSGVNAYIQSVEEETLSQYPLQIESTGIDFTSLMAGSGNESIEPETGEVGITEMVTTLFSKMNSNDLESLKVYLDSKESGIDAYATSVEYSYDVSPQIYRIDEDDVRQVNPDQSFSSIGLGSGGSSNNMMSMSTDVFYEMPENTALYENQYTVQAGRWPESYDECVLVLTSNGTISDLMMYTLGLRDAKELDTMVQQFADEENVTIPTDIHPYSYDEILGTEFKVIQPADLYEYDEEYKVWIDQSDNKAYIKELAEAGESLTIVGIVQPADESSIAMLSSGIGYTPALTRHIIDAAADSPIVKEQLAHQNTNVFTGQKFGEEESTFDMSTLFTVDTEALADAFQVDESLFQVDLSGLSDLSIDPSLLSGAFTLDMDSFTLTDLIDFDELLPELTRKLSEGIADMEKNLDLTVTAQEMQSLTQDMIAGFQESLQGDMDIEFVDPVDSFAAYLATEDAQERLAFGVQKLFDNSLIVNFSQEQLLAAASALVASYQEYAAANDISEDTPQTVLAYLGSPQGQQDIQAQAEQILKESISIQITPEEIREFILDDLLAGYTEYISDSSAPDSTVIGEAFLEYLRSEEGHQRLYQNLTEIMDIQEASKELTNLLQTAGSELSADIEEQVQTNMTGLLSQLGSSITSAMEQVAAQVGTSMASAIQQAMSSVGANLENAVSIDGDAFMDAIQVKMNEEELTNLLTSMMSGENAGYEYNLRSLGYVDPDVPSSIEIYPKNFSSKESIIGILDDYNARMEAEGNDSKVIRYTDMVGTLMSSVTDIVDVISYVLVAFVAISLVVSSIMIGVITYISVLERRKEIGILRAIGASKRNISQVFNAETFIIGLCAGLIGIGLTLLLLIPGNILIHSLADTTEINAALPPVSGIILVALSVLLTLLGGLIPSKKAAKSDPVTALRSE
ncbi:MAG TPA: ABC transporter ATP-binding protein/permease [Candidatus Blautia faecavium]|uniref:ABC transporter ATP-binding protein/permease n=1 Tax=Candidatus Blautia faecavium TaxID=2838487 RepID=A0A9D2RV03_9FIRM|nr:ABC transporter ATP-binding protein/permease [Candidatus Blautia faecavium]